MFETVEDIIDFYRSKQTDKKEDGNMNPKVEEILQHHGVKGMKWGVRRDRKPNNEATFKKMAQLEKKMKSTKDKEALKSLEKEYGKLEDSVSYSKGPSKLRKTIDSIKRENEWRKVTKNLDKMSTKSVQEHAKRLQLENDLKRLSRTKGVGSKKDRKDYLDRIHLNNDEISRKVNRLRAKDTFNKQVNEANKTQIKVAKKIVAVAAPIAAHMIINGTIKPRDIVNIAMNPKGASASMVKKATDGVLNRVLK